MIQLMHLSAIEILDSRGRPTIKARCTLSNGIVAQASVPSGASTGSGEALELRDGDLKRYNGMGCLKAVAKVNQVIAPTMVGKSLGTQQEIDAHLLTLDQHEGPLGANAILAVSLVVARAHALASGQPLYRYFAQSYGIEGSAPLTLPMPTINLFSGGKHAGGQVPIQDVLVVPVAAKSIEQALAMTYAVYQAAATLTAQQYGVRPLKADEGGLAPPFPNTAAMLQDAVHAIELAGYRAGDEIALAVDVASSHFWQEGRYHFEGQALDSAAMIQLLTTWLSQYPIISLEDGLAEEDWTGWSALYAQANSQVMILGDDLLCTNPQRIRYAQQVHAANSLLLKVNQIGTVSAALEARRLAAAANWKVVVSARSGETEDDWLADLAVGWAGDYIKIGSIMQSERLAKYNRLLEIEGYDQLRMKHLT